MSVLRLNHKSGAPFLFEGLYLDPQTGVPINLTGLTISSLIKAKDGSLRSTCLITIKDQTDPDLIGRFILEVPNTSNWVPFEVLYWDVASGSNGVLTPTQQTVEISVGRRVT